MPRERAQIDLGGPLLREREGVRLTERSLSGRLAEVLDRFARVCEAAAPAFSDEEWSLVSYEGWSAIQFERLTSRDSPQDIDTLAWSALWTAVAERGAAWAALAKRLRTMSVIERIAVLERVEAYGRAEAMRLA